MWKAIPVENKMMYVSELLEGYKKYEESLRVIKFSQFEPDDKGWDYTKGIIEWASETGDNLSIWIRWPYHKVTDICTKTQSKTHKHIVIIDLLLF